MCSIDVCPFVRVLPACFSCLLKFRDSKGRTNVPQSGAPITRTHVKGGLIKNTLKHNYCTRTCTPPLRLLLNYHKRRRKYLPVEFCMLERRRQDSVLHQVRGSTRYVSLNSGLNMYAGVQLLHKIQRSPNWSRIFSNTKVAVVVCVWSPQ